MKHTKITFLGSGAWGTALASILSSNPSRQIVLWGKSPAEIEDISFHHENSKYFPGKKLADNIEATLSLEDALMNTDLLVLALPSGAVSSVLPEVAKLLKTKPLMVSLTKGFDEKTGLGLSSLIREIMGDSIRGFVSMMGPTFASEVMNGDSTCIAAISQNKDDAIEVQQLFSTPSFRVYTQNDVIGAEIGCGMKNIIAIASGILGGLGYGDNARASLITRGLAEITRFGVHSGAQEKTFLGLTGVGDLFLTCSSKQSRNYSFGYEVGKANDASVVLSNLTKTVEGIPATKIIHEIAAKKGISVPIVDAVYAVIYENQNPRKMAESLMSRSLKAE